MRRAKELKVLFFFGPLSMGFFGCVVILDGIGRDDFFWSYFFKKLFLGWGGVGWLGTKGGGGYSHFFFPS